MKLLFTLLCLLVLSASVHARGAPVVGGNHIILNGSTQYLSGTTPASFTYSGLGIFAGRMMAARLGHGTDQVVFDMAGYGILYIKAESAGVTNLQFVPATGTGTVTKDISSLTSGFIWRIQYDPLHLTYLLQVWGPKGGETTYLNNEAATATTSVDLANRAFTIGAKRDGTLHCQMEMDFFRYVGPYSGYYSAAIATWWPGFFDGANTLLLDYRFENNLTNSGSLSVTLTGTGSPTYAANANDTPVLVAPDKTGQAKGRILLSAATSYDYDDTSGAVGPDQMSVSTNWACVSAPGAGCGALTIRHPSHMATWVDGATTVGTYTFSVTIQDNSAATTTDSSVQVTVAAVSADVGNVSCYVDEPCLVDASASTGYDSIDVNFGESVPGSIYPYRMAIPKGVHQYRSAGAFTITATATDAQSSPTSSVDTATATVTARPTADAGNTINLTDSGSSGANFISTTQCTTDATGNMTKLQSAVNIAAARNTVAQQITLRAHNGAGTQCTYQGTLTLTDPTSTSQILVISSGTLPATHKRITTADTGQMPILLTASVNTAVVTTLGVSAYYKLRGLELKTSAIQQASIVRIGDTDVDITLAQLPHDIIFQHCIIRPTSESIDVLRGFNFNGNRLTVTDSQIGPLSYDSNESQSLNAWSSEGQLVINNNYIQVGSIGTMFGGAPSLIQGIIPRYIEFRENYTFKPLAWARNIGDGAADIIQNPAWDGRYRLCKNLFEIKSGSDVVLAGNKWEGNRCREAGQVGWGIVLTAGGDSGDWRLTENIDLSYSYLSNSYGGVLMRGSDTTDRRFNNNFRINHLLIDRLEPGPVGGNGYGIFFATSPQNVRIQHSSILGPSNMSGPVFSSGATGNAGMIYENNIQQDGANGWNGDGMGSSLANKVRMWPGFFMHHNVAIGGTSGNYPSTDPNDDWQFPANEAAVGFTNAAGFIFSLAGGSTFENDASDGTNPGVDWVALQAYTAHTVDGDWTAVSVLPGTRGRFIIGGRLIIRH